MAHLAKSMAEKSTDLGSRPFGRKEKAQCNKSTAGRHRYVLVHPSRGLEQSILVLGRNVGRAESGIAASLGVHMDGSREEGSGRAPNAAIPAARLLHYIGRGESHRPTCCYPDLYAGAQGDPRGGHC
jgi:hypothetical protein